MTLKDVEVEFVAASHQHEAWILTALEEAALIVLTTKISLVVVPIEAEVALLRKETNHQEEEDTEEKAAAAVKMANTNSEVAVEEMKEQPQVKEEHGERDGVFDPHADTAMMTLVTLTMCLPERRAAAVAF